jgi:hypothetical protein
LVVTKVAVAIFVEQMHRPELSSKLVNHVEIPTTNFDSSERQYRRTTRPLQRQNYWQLAELSSMRNARMDKCFTCYALERSTLLELRELATFF